MKTTALLIGLGGLFLIAEGSVRLIEALEAKDSRRLWQRGCRLARIMSLKKAEVG